MNKDAILGLVRHVMTFAGGFLVANGTIDDPGLTEAVASVITLIGLVWSAWEKKARAAS